MVLIWQLAAQFTCMELIEMAIDLISTTTLTGAAASISLSSIPQTGKDLMVILSARATTSVNTVNISVSGSTANFSRRALRGSGSTITVVTGAASAVAGTLTESGSSANTFADTTFYFYNYASTTLEKWINIDSGQENATASTNTNVYLHNFYRSNTGAVTSLLFTAASGNLEVGTMLSLYTIS